jgi:hypothetical protein
MRYTPYPSNVSINIPQSALTPSLNYCTPSALLNKYPTSSSIETLNKYPMSVPPKDSVKRENPINNERVNKMEKEENLY